MVHIAFGKEFGKSSRRIFMVEHNEEGIDAYRKNMDSLSSPYLGCRRSGKSATQCPPSFSKL